MTSKPEFPVYIALGVVIIGIVILLCMGRPVPVELWALAGALIAGGLGITVPGLSTAVGSEPAPAPVAATPAATAAAAAPLAPVAPIAPPAAATVHTAS